MSDEVRVTVIGTGFDHRPGAARAARRAARGRRPTAARGSTTASARSLEISDDDIDVPPFLR